MPSRSTRWCLHLHILQQSCGSPRLVHLLSGGSCGAGSFELSSSFHDCLGLSLIRGLDTHPLDCLADPLTIASGPIGPPPFSFAGHSYPQRCVDRSYGTYSTGDPPCCGPALSMGSIFVPSSLLNSSEHRVPHVVRLRRLLFSSRLGPLFSPLHGCGLLFAQPPFDQLSSSWIVVGLSGPRGYLHR